MTDTPAIFSDWSRCVLWQIIKGIFAGVIDLENSVMKSPTRIVSLLPSATEMLYALGLGDRVVAVSHACDSPPEVCKKPKATISHIDDSRQSADIDSAVQQRLVAGNPLYDIDIALLEKLSPDLVITQSKCAVCAIEYSDVMTAVARAGVSDSASILALQPHSLDDVFDDMLHIARVCGVAPFAKYVVQSLRERVNRIQCNVDLIPHESRPRTALIEWIDPIMIAGNWMPEMLRLAGGRGPDFETSGKSHFITWEDISTFDPEIVIFCPCGFDLQRACEEVKSLHDPIFRSLHAVHHGAMYAVDGNAYFNRSGPRLVDSLEILAHLLHPQQIGPPEFAPPINTAWSRLV